MNEGCTIALAQPHLLLVLSSSCCQAYMGHVQRGSGEVFFLFTTWSSLTPTCMHSCAWTAEAFLCSPISTNPVCLRPLPSVAFGKKALPFLCFSPLIYHLNTHIYIPLTLALLRWRNVCIHVPTTPSPCLCSLSFYKAWVFLMSSAGERQAELLHMFKKWVHVREHTHVQAHALVCRYTLCQGVNGCLAHGEQTGRDEHRLVPL